MKPARINFPGLKAGSRFAQGFKFCDENGTPVDLSPYTGALVIQRVGAPHVRLAATTENGKLILAGTPLNVVWDLDLKLRAGEYTFDLVLFSADARELPVLTGDIELEASTV